MLIPEDENSWEESVKAVASVVDEVYGSVMNTATANVTISANKMTGKRPKANGEVTASRPPKPYMNMSSTLKLEPPSKEQTSTAASPKTLRPLQYHQYTPSVEE
jgi:hypothetical protein